MGAPMLSRLSMLSLPPVLSAEVARAIPDEVRSLAAAVDEEIRHATASADLMVVLAQGPDLRVLRPGTEGTLRGLGPASVFRLPGDRQDALYRRACWWFSHLSPDLSEGWPLEPAFLAMRLEQAKAPPVLFVIVPWHVSPSFFAASLSGLLEEAGIDRFGLMLLGNLSSCHARPMAGHRVDPRADGSDRDFAARLREAAFEHLSRPIGHELCELNNTLALLMSCAAPFAAAMHEPAVTLTYDEAPFGIGYLVGSIRGGT